MGKPVPEDQTREERIAEAILASTNRDLPSRANPNDAHYHERLEQALAIYCAGYSQRASVEATGASISALQKRVERHPELRKIHAEALEAAKERAASEAIAQDLEIADEAGRELLARLTDEEKRKKMSTGELNFIRGTARDKAIKALDKVKPRERDTFTELLGRLRSDGGTVSVSVQPNRTAIDVTPEKGDG